MEIEVTWTRKAQKQIKETYDYISLDSELYALKVADLL